MTRDEILKAAAAVPGWMSEPDLQWLIEQSSTRAVVIELGSWKGRSTKAMALATLGVVYAVDHWEGSASEEATTKKEASELGPDALFEIFKANLGPEIASGKCVPVRLSSDKAVGKLTEILGARKADMIFIDADHEYSMVKRDIELWRPMLAEGGLLCGHDYPWPGVNKAVAELIPRHRYLHGTWIWYGPAK